MQIGLCVVRNVGDAECRLTFLLSSKCKYMHDNESQKQETLFLPITLPNVDRFSSLSSADSGEICNKVAIKDPMTPPYASLHYLVKPKCHKLTII